MPAVIVRLISFVRPGIRARQQKESLVLLAPRQKKRSDRHAVSKLLTEHSSERRKTGLRVRVASSPSKRPTDSARDLYVADGSRVLEYLDPTAPTGGMPGTPGHPGDTTADVVFGQNGDFAGGACNGNNTSTIVNASTLCNANGVAVDVAGNVYIADTQNNRVLAFQNASAEANPRFPAKSRRGR